jgi:hypothetical protein
MLQRRREYQKASADFAQNGRKLNGRFSGLAALKDGATSVVLLSFGGLAPLRAKPWGPFSAARHSIAIMVAQLRRSHRQNQIVSASLYKARPDRGRRAARVQ